MSFLRSRQFRLLLGIGISLVSIYLAVGNVDLPGVWDLLAAADLGLLALAVAVMAVNQCAKAVRWRLLLGKARDYMSFGHSLRVILVAQLLNNYMPARIGDLSRVYLAGEMGMSRSFALGTMALEKLLDMVMYALLFLLLLLLMPVPEWVSRSAYLLVVAALTGLLVTLVIFSFRGGFTRAVEWLACWLPAGLAERIVAVVRTALTSLEVLRSRHSNLRLSFWSAFIWITYVAPNYLVLLALRIDAPPVSALFVLIVLLAGISIPSVPGRVGVFEYLCVLSLTVFGIAHTLAFSYGVLLHAVVFGPLSLAGLVALWFQGPVPRQVAVPGPGEPS